MLRVHTASRLEFLALCCVAAALGFATLSRAQGNRHSNDFDNDGVQDIIGRNEGYNATAPVAGSVAIVRGTNHKEIFAAVGPALNDRFARSAEGWRFSATGVPQLIVTAPFGAGTGTNSRGQVFVYNTTTGALRLTLASQTDQWFSDQAAVIPDATGDAVGEILVGGARYFNNRWEYKTFIFDGGSGAQIGELKVVLDAVVRFVDGGGLAYSRADLNDDGVVNQDDVFDLVGMVGQSAAPGTREDFDDNGIVDALDVHIAVTAMLRGERTIAASGYLIQSEADWSTAQLAWADLNGSTILYNAFEIDIGAGSAVPGIRQCGSGTPSNSCVVQIQNCPAAGLVPGEIIYLTGGAYNGGNATCTFSIEGPNNGLLQDLGGGAFKGLSTPAGGCVLVKLECQVGGQTCCQYCNICVGASPTCPSGQLLLSGCPEHVVALPQLRDLVLAAFLNNYQTNATVDWDLILLPSGQADCHIPELECTNWQCPTSECPRAHELSLRSHPKLAGITQQLQAAAATDTFRVVCVRAHWLATLSTPQGPLPCLKCATCTIAVGLLDSDGDGLMDVDEAARGTNPQLADTDGDGFCDGDEVHLFETNPLSPTSFPTRPRVDADGDGLPDNADVKARNYVQPRIPELFDNDFDGVPDAAELDIGLNPLAEFTLGAGLADMRSPAWAQADRDQDGLDDKFELRNGLNPFVRDMDNDGIPDGVELRTGTDPRVSLRNESGDTDGDGLSDYEERFIYHSDPGRIDSDNDGLPDFFEVAAGLDPTRAFSHSRVVNGVYVAGVHDAMGDLDYDGLNNLDEYRWRTDPVRADTDGDGTDDGTEIGTPSTPGTGDPLGPSDGSNSEDNYCWLMITIGGHWPGNQGTDCNNSASGLWQTGDIRNIPGALGGGSQDQKRPNRWTITITGPGVGGGAGTGAGGSFTVATGSNGERTIAYRKVRKGTCFTATMGNGGPTNGWGGAANGYFVGIAPVDMTVAGHPVCASCCCLNQSADTTGNFPNGLLGNHCYGADPNGQSTTVCLPLVDIDIDSDNNNGTSNPSRAAAEEKAETESPTGKLVLVNNNDADADGIPDFADGFNFDQVSGSADDRITSPSASTLFIPVIFELSGFPENHPPASVRFSYPGSDPAAISLVADPNGGPSTYALPTAGIGRLWRKSANQARTITALNGSSGPNGDYIIPNHSYSLADLNIPLGGGTLVLWLEAVKPSTVLKDIPLGVAAEGLCDDTAYATAFTSRFNQVTEGADGAPSYTPVEKPQVSNPSPVITLDGGGGAVYSNVRLAPSAETFVADLVFHGTVDDALSDLVPGSAGVIAWLSVELNGGPLSLASGGPDTGAVAVTYTKNNDVELGTVLHPFDYSGQFSRSFGGVAVLPGWNVIRVSAHNAHGFTGYAEYGFFVGITPPPDDSLSATVDFNGDDPFDPVATTAATLHVSRSIGSSVVLDETVTLPRDPTRNGRFEAGGVVLVVEGSPLSASSPDSIILVLTHAGAGSLEESLDATEDGAATLRFAAQRTITDADRLDWNGYASQISQGWGPVASEGGSFNPLVLELVGPAGIEAAFDRADIQGKHYHIIPDSAGADPSGKLLLGEWSKPTPILALARSRLSPPPPTPVNDEHAQRRDGVLDYGAGFGAGICDTGVGMWDGVSQIGKGAWHLVRDYNTVSIVWRLVTTGQVLTIEDNRTVSVAWDFVSTVAGYVQRIVTDETLFVHAVLTDNSAELEHLNEESRMAVQFAVETLQHITTYLQNLDAHDVGRVHGRITGEVGVQVLLAVGTAGAGNIAKSATMLAVLTKVEELPIITRLANSPQVVDALRGAAQLTRSLPLAERWGRAAESLAAWAERIKRTQSVGDWVAYQRVLNGLQELQGGKRFTQRAIQGLTVHTTKNLYEAATPAGGVVVQGIVPTVAEADAVLNSHRGLGGWLQAHEMTVHHPFQESWFKVAFKRVHGRIPTRAEIDSMPSLILPNAWHTGAFEAGNRQSIHRMIEQELGRVPTRRTTAETVVSFRDVYRRFNTLYGAEADFDYNRVWTVTEDWLIRQGIPVPP